MYVMTDSGDLFANELTNWLIEYSSLNQFKYQIYVYYKYVRDGSKLVVLSYFDDCVYWYRSE